MSRSLQKRLTSMLGIAVLVSGLALALMSFILAYNEAKEFQDDVLRQTALLAVHGSSTDPSAVDGTGQNRLPISVDDPESRIDVIHLPKSPRPAWLAENLTPGFYTVETGAGRLRVFLRKDPSGGTTVVTQPTDIRDEIAINSALRILAPLLLLLPAMAWFIMRIVRCELAPVKNLAGHVDAQPANLLQPIPDRDVPQEIAPFVHAINRLLTRVSELMEQQRRFIADAAHELRSPLTALSIQAQNLNQPGLPEKIRERVLPLQDAIERARKLTEQLLNLARIQAGTAQTKTVDASAVSRQLIAEYLPLAEARGIDLGLDETASIMLADTGENLYLILKNALENAIKYSPEGGEVTLRIASVGNNAVFEVIDNGLGIPVSELQRVGDPFYRLPGANGEGCGLGLAIAMEAAAAQGGNVSLFNRQEGMGLIFRYSQNVRPGSQDGQCPKTLDG